MPYRVTFVLGSFDGDRKSDARRVLRHKNLYVLLDALTRIDLQEIIAANGKLPPIYESGVRYEPEPEGQEDWMTALALFQLPANKRVGDCEDLACWRAAELQMRGIAAHPVFVWRKMPNGSHLYHIVVRHPNGDIEDPSKRLGMK